MTDMACLHSAGLKPEGIATLIVRPILGVHTDLKKTVRSFVLEYQRQVSFATYNLFSFLPFPSLSLQPPTASHQLCRNSPTAFTAS